MTTIPNTGNAGAPALLPSVENATLARSRFCHVTFSGAQTVSTSTDTRVPFPTTDYDPWNLHTWESPTSFFGPAVSSGLAGYYHLMAVVQMSAPCTGSMRKIRVADQDGNEWGVNRVPMATTVSGDGYDCLQVVGFGYLAEGEWVTVTVSHDAGVNGTISAGYCVFEFKGTNA